jgi:hypothetical protein
MPPSDTLDQEIGKVFSSATSPSPDHTVDPKVSNANLTPEALASVFRSAYGRDIKVSPLNTFLTSTSCQAVYTINKATNPSQNDQVTVEITNCTQNEAADAAMKNYLYAFERKLSEIGSPAKLGSRSLQTGGSVFWVRNNVFAKVLSDAAVGKSFLFHLSMRRLLRFFVYNSDSSSLVGSPPDPKAPPPPKESKPSPPAPSPLISSLAEALDKYLADNAIPPQKQTMKPKMEIHQPDHAEHFTAAVNQPFTISLADGHQSLHPIKPVEIEDQDVLLPTKNGSSDGVYELYPLKAGSTKVRLLAAHENTLVIGSREVTVTVAASH